jgi:hypothetical protein
MNLPGFNAESTLYKSEKTPWLSRTALDGPQILPQLGFGFGGGGGITYPPGGDDCYCCTSWVRCPCGLSLG